METLLERCVLLPARDHALPFRVIFEELLQRREADVLARAADHWFPKKPLHPGQPPEKWVSLSPEEKQRVLGRLRNALQEQETAYDQLQIAQMAIDAGKSSEELDAKLCRCQAADKSLKKILHAIPKSALCLSGGGIRSASFSLGVMEGLARFSRDTPSGKGGVMDEFDYLSTVSGGGYIGSWLMSWVWRRYRQGGDKDWMLAYRQVVSSLAGQRNISPDPKIEPQAVTGGDPEPQTKRHLRAYTSFLAPALGATLDTATLGAIVLRNLLVNWVMLVPVLLATVSGAHALGRILLRLQQNFQEDPPREWRYDTVLLCFLLAAIIAALELPSHDNQRSLSETKASGTKWRNTARKWLETVKTKLRPAAGVSFVCLTLLGTATLTVSQQSGARNGPSGPCFRSVLAFTHLLAPLAMLAHWLGNLLVRARVVPASLSRTFLTETVIAFFGFGILACSIVLAERRRLEASREAMNEMMKRANDTMQSDFFWREFWLWPAAFGATLVSALLSSALLVALRRYVYTLLLSGGPLLHFKIPNLNGRLFLVLGLPLVTGVLLLCTSMLCALLGVFERDEDREWWVRCGGALLGFNLCWVVGQTLVFFGATANHKVYSTIAGLLLAGISSLAGSSAATAATASGTSLSKLSSVGKFLSKYKLLLPAAGFVSVLLIGTGVVALEGILQKKISGVFFTPGADGRAALLLLAITSALTVLLNLAININLFSLQGMYRMRLMRAYLGASNVFRRPDPFTGFDPRDTPRMFQMPCTGGVPMHLVNCTLNLTGTSNAAWKQRRAEIFGFSPLFCGSWRTGYVRTEHYASRHNGPDLAAAMSISGSAFNPNMGYHTSPLLSILMTFFNVRLGMWLPNPKRPTIKGWDDEKYEDRMQRFFHRPGPLFALGPLLQELLGNADDTRRFIELTDGGHFENLALYEMVMRRVQTIVLVDAGADTAYEFEDLGNAIRKIQIDLGVTIDFDGAMPMSTRKKKTNLYCAVGTIHYGCVDEEPGCDGKAFEGKLIYIKPVLTGNEPADIFQYARTHPTFPNETTVNQFFNEAQFESYRHLGSYVVDKIVKAPMAREKWPDDYGSLNSLLKFASRFGKTLRKEPPRTV